MKESETEKTKHQKSNIQLDKYFEGKIDHERNNIAGYDPDIVYAVCIASKEVAHRKKQSKAKHFPRIIRNIFRRNFNCTSKENEHTETVCVDEIEEIDEASCSKAKEVKKDEDIPGENLTDNGNEGFLQHGVNIAYNNNNSSNNNKHNREKTVMEVEHDLINNCPLVWTQSNASGRKASISERHRNDRLMVASACRKYTQMQNINGEMF